MDGEDHVEAHFLGAVEMPPELMAVLRNKFGKPPGEGQPSPTDPVTRPRPELVVVVPTYRRQTNVMRLLDAMVETCRANTHVIFVTPDDRDSAPLEIAVTEARKRMNYLVGVNILSYPKRERAQGVTIPLNRGVATALLMLNPYAVAYLGDDHLPRTVGWDAELLAALRTRGGGFAYGDDMMHGEQLPTAVAISSDIIRALGWFALPTLRHLYIDNVWKTLGECTGRLIYLPHVTIEHMHHERGVAALDKTYETGLMETPGAATDQSEFHRWVHSTVVLRNVTQIRRLYGEPE